MKAFAGILTGEIDGTSAPDPSDPPASITMSSEEGEEELPDEGEEEEVVDTDIEEEEPEEEGEEEDLEPPIKAGSPADLSEIRKRVRRLMRS